MFNLTFPKWNSCFFSIPWLKTFPFDNFFLSQTKGTGINSGIQVEIEVLNSSLSNLLESSIDITKVSPNLLLAKDWDTERLWACLSGFLALMLQRLLIVLHCPKSSVITSWFTHGTFYGGCPGGSDGKEFSCQCRRPSLITGLGRSLEKGMANHANIHAWRIPWTEEPGRLQGCKESDMTESLTLNTN